MRDFFLGNTAQYHKRKNGEQPTRKQLEALLNLLARQK